MARRNHKKNSKKCPEPLNTLIDIAGGLAMNAVADHMEKKYHYSKKGKINPYKVSAVGIASGRMKSTKDIVRTGAVLGALGSFDVDEEDIPEKRTYRSAAELDSGIVLSSTRNRYAWRLNCEDGTEYGIDPKDYETRELYHEALSEAKGITPDSQVQSKVAKMFDSSTYSNDVFVYCRVSRLDNGVNDYFILEGTLPQIGDTITVPTEKGETTAIVIGIAEYSSDQAPIPPDRTPRITAK